MSIGTKLTGTFVDPGTKTHQGNRGAIAREPICHREPDAIG